MGVLAQESARTSCKTRWCPFLPCKKKDAYSLGLQCKTRSISLCRASIPVVLKVNQGNHAKEKLHNTMQDKELMELVNTKVVVYLTEDGVTRNHFEAQISVHGKLEAMELEDGNKYRVVMSDQAYCYFTARNVVLINTLASVPSISIKIEVQE